MVFNETIINTVMYMQHALQIMTLSADETAFLFPHIQIETQYQSNTSLSTERLYEYVDNYVSAFQCSNG